MENCQDEINRLDGELGDGDLGITMARGMATIAAEVDELPEDFGMALFTCGKCFTKVSGSSFGTLLATGLMAAAKSCRGKSAIEWTQISQLLEVALEAMKKRGKGELGEKTVLDLLAGLRDDLAGLSTAKELSGAALASCHKTLDTFRDRQAQQGRARFYGAKSVGKDDPGMLAFTRVVEALVPAEG